MSGRFRPPPPPEIGDRVLVERPTRLLRQDAGGAAMVGTVQADVQGAETLAEEGGGWWWSI
jgi:hypothetical protein